MLPAIQQQAMRIARGNDDIAQDIQAMVFCTYHRALERGKELSIGELVNVMKYRASDIRKGARPHFGNISTKTTNCVFHPRNYFNGDVELLSLDFQQNESDDSDKGDYTTLTATRNFADNILFEISFRRFIRKLDSESRRILRLRLEGYKNREIAKQIGLRIHIVEECLRLIGKRFVRYFDLPDRFLETYGIT